MATLTVTAYYTRLTIKYGALFLAFLLFARVSWLGGSWLINYYFPAPPPTPTVIFGKLPALPFPEVTNPAIYNFALETPTGDLPNFPTQSLVYFMPPSASSLLALEESTEIAHDLGFADNRHLLAETIYRFERGETPLYMDINIINKTFSINYDLAQTPEILNTKPRSTSDAVQAVRNFISVAGIFPEDLEEGKTRFEYIKIKDNELVGALSLSEAQFVKVNFLRRDYNELPVVTTDKVNGNVWFLISGDQSRDKQIVAGEFHYFPVLEERSSTYPLRTSAQAWEELKAGRAHIAQKPQIDGPITIRRVYLAYYDSGKPQEFFQPVIVFEGDGEFTAYVPAISTEYYTGIPAPSPTPGAFPTPEPDPTESTEATEESETQE